MEPKSNTILYYTPAIGWGVFILVMSLLPGSKLPDALLALDDFIIHMSVYIVLSGSIFFALSKSGFSRKRCTLFSIATASIYGVLIEFAQTTLTMYRSFSQFDIYANCIGALLGSLLAMWTIKRFVR